MTKVDRRFLLTVIPLGFASMAVWWFGMRTSFDLLSFKIGGLFIASVPWIIVAMYLWRSVRRRR